MTKELKARIAEIEKVRTNLCNSGAILREKKRTLDTYYNQPKGRVLKLSESKAGNVLVSLRAEGEGFVIEKSEPINDLASKKKELAENVKCILERSIETYSYKESKVHLHRIRGLGDFLILESDNPKPEDVERFLGNKTPEYIKVSFDELKNLS